MPRTASPDFRPTQRVTRSSRSWGENGSDQSLLALAGNPLPPLPVRFRAESGVPSRRFRPVVEKYAGQSFPDLHDRRDVHIPLGNRTAKADYAISREQAKQIGIEEIALLERLRGEAVNAIQQFRETQYRLVAASRARAASERVFSPNSDASTSAVRQRSWCCSASSRLPTIAGANCRRKPISIMPWSNSTGSAARFSIPTTSMHRH